MNPLAALVLSAALLGSSGAATVTPPPILFAADDLPAVRGEVYRLDANGRRVDLSKSAFRDFMPAVAPDGKHVAFVSARSGKNAIYEVGIDGSGLRRLDSPALGTVAQLAWAPSSKELAVVSGDLNERLSVLAPGRKAKVLARAAFIYNPEWSPDSRLVTATIDHGHGRRRIDAFTPAGSLAWHAPFRADAGWSSRGVFFF